MVIYLPMGSQSTKSKESITTWLDLVTPNCYHTLRCRSRWKSAIATVLMPSIRSSWRYPGNGTVGHDDFYHPNKNGATNPQILWRFEKVRKTNGSSEKKQRQHFLGLPKSLSFTFFLGELHWVCYWRTLPTVSQIVWWVTAKVLQKCQANLSGLKI